MSVRFWLGSVCSALTSIAVAGCTTDTTALVDVDDVDAAAVSDTRPRRPSVGGQSGRGGAGGSSGGANGQPDAAVDSAVVPVRDALDAAQPIDTAAAPDAWESDARIDTGSERDASAPPTPNEREEPVAPMFVIDDFEDCDGSIKRAGGRSGIWFNGAEFRSTVEPTPFGTVGGGVPGSSNCSARVTGTIAAGSWGQTVAILSHKAYSVAPYEGVRFWAKGKGSVKFAIATTGTVDRVAGGTCAALCWDNHGANITLTPAWKKYEFTWADLKQSGWGATVAFDRTQARRIHFEFYAGTFDFNLDDLQFLPPQLP